jgi:hypothetical protein
METNLQMIKEHYKSWTSAFVPPEEKETIAGQETVLKRHKFIHWLSHKF